MATDPSQLMSMLAQNSGLQGQYFMNGQDQSRKQQFDDQALALNRAKLTQMQRETDADAGFQSAWTSYLRNPNMDDLAKIGVQYPTHAAAVKDFWAIKGPEARQSQLQAIAPVLNLLDNNKPAEAISHLKRLRDAADASKLPTDDYDQEIAALQSGDKDSINAVRGTLMMHVASIDRDGKFAETLARVQKSFGGGEPYTLSQGQERRDGNNRVVASVAPKPDYLVVHEGDKAIPLNGAPSLGLEGSVPAPGVPGAGNSGDVSRLINSDAGGGYVPQSVGTLGQFVGFGKALNRRGAKSSSAGTYQINGTTMAEFAPKALGPDWKSAPFNAETQDKVGEAIFNWAKQQPDPAAALRGRWVSLKPGTAEQLIQGKWQQARGTIAQGETGGGAGASASQGQQPAAAMPGDPPGTVYGAPKAKPEGEDPTVGDPSLTGNAYLATIPPAMRSQVKAIADGRIAVPRTGTKLGSRILDAVTAYDPTFDAANAQSRIKTRVDFTSGKSAIAKTALNTAMGHLLHLDSQAKDLGNFSTLPGWINPIYNSGRQMAGDTKIPAFEQTKTAAASEMRKVFAGSAGGNLQELKDWESSLSSSQSYEQLHEVIKNGVTLMGSRLDALKSQYADGMGRSDNVPAMINPKVAEATRKRFGIDLGGSYSPRQTANSQAPAPGTVQRGYRFNGGDPADRNSWTKVR